MPNDPIPMQTTDHQRAQVAQWQQVRKLSRWAANRPLRRVVIVAWLGVLILDVQLGLIAARNGPFLLAASVLLFLITSWAMQRMGRGLAQPTLEDRAVLTYGEAFDDLKEEERSNVFDQQIRDQVIARSTEDIRDIDLNTRAQAMAWRIATPLVLVTACLFWILGHHDGYFPAFTAECALITLYFALPTIIRLWSEPGPIPDTQLSLISTDKQS